MQLSINNPVRGYFSCSWSLMTLQDIFILFSLVYTTSISNVLKETHLPSQTCSSHIFLILTYIFSLSRLKISGVIFGLFLSFISSSNQLINPADFTPFVSNYNLLQISNATKFHSINVFINYVIFIRHVLVSGTLVRIEDTRKNIAYSLLSITFKCCGYWYRSLRVK